MKKYLKMSGLIVAYLVILYAVMSGVKWFVFNVCSLNKTLNDFLWSNRTLFSFTISIITVCIYYVIFKLRGKNLFKVCSFQKMEVKDVLGITMMGISMSIFTTSFTSISFIGSAFPQFEEYMKGFFESKGSFLILVAMLIVLPMFEEIIFRGIIFNELRENIPLIAAIIVQAVIYGILQFSPVLGTYAAIGSMIYVLPYIWTRSLFGSILVQDTCILSLLILRRTGIKEVLAGTGDAVLILLSLIGVVGMFVFAYFVWKDSTKKQSTMKTVEALN
ncbi:CPBP family intramembrane glutamic endopeptidase [Acetivibrio mesophilus]|uniref:CPBP family intramembrane metalloprotease n=1 Tax=Acetivibrio mesophilus TaxID=2487273 RepID=A0A4Q0I4D1_9FIRM|nr:type II CAAX endopeptidase family protein [Acetivibrio mesophilus]ODM26052.1 CAAX protease [Clostridium sp. Bc-iso-3]RXE59150.1 CPBP family intramembrane metalloprotease [Acetivibrio mesophilus]HHV29162.1 CPBP family intramembrane metalloprotease [Clostridium sp.]